MAVTPLFRFVMDLVPEGGTRRAHENFFNTYKVDWETTVWKVSNDYNANSNLCDFKSLDGKCYGCTMRDYFVPYISTPVNLDDYL